MSIGHTPKLRLPSDKIEHARQLATAITQPIEEFIADHTTVTVERATLRLAGASGANAEGVPVPNLIVDQVRSRLEDGALLPYVNALVRTGYTVQQLNEAIAAGLNINDMPLGDRTAVAASAPR